MEAFDEMEQKINWSTKAFHEHHSMPSQLLVEDPDVEFEHQPIGFDSQNFQIPQGWRIWSIEVDDVFKNFSYKFW